MPKWNKHDTKILRKYYESYTNSKIKGMLDVERSESTISKKAQAMGIKSKHNRWSGEDKEIISRYYGKKSNKEIKRMLKEDHSITSIKKQGRSLGVADSSKAKEKWNDHDLEIIRNFYPDHSTTKTQEMLDRDTTKIAIRGKARSLGINKTNKGYLEEELLGTKWGKKTDRERKEFFKEKYFEEELSLESMARFTDIGSTALERHAKRLGFSLRSKTETQGQTDIEQKLALGLDAMGINYTEQKPIGPWQVDFYIPDRRLVIEADGVYWHSLDEVKERDKRKNTWLRKHGYEVLRLDGDTIRDGNVKSKVNSAMQYAAV